MGSTHEVGSTYQAAALSLDLLQTLAPRQRDVLAMLWEGLPNKLIGRRLKISADTVKFHIVHIHRALGVWSRLQAVAAARSLEFDARAFVQTLAQPASRIKPITPVVDSGQSSLSLGEGTLPLLAAFMSRRLDVALA